MKKLIISTLVLFFSISFSFGAIANKNTGNLALKANASIQNKMQVSDIANTQKTIPKVINKIKKVKDFFEKKIKNRKNGLIGAIIYMIIGILFLLIAQIIPLWGLTYIIGAIFFIIGAIKLLIKIL